MPIGLLVVALIAAAPAPKKESKQSPKPSTTEAKITRKHQPGQRYSMTFNTTHVNLGTSKSFKGIATVKTVALDEVSFDVELGELVWSTNGKPTRKAKGVVLKVTLVRNSIDAQVVSPGTAGDSAEMELTSFEMLMGDLCQPPPEALTVGKASSEWTLVEIKGDVAQLTSTPTKGGSQFACETTVSLTDGFAGQRKGTMRMDLERRDPNTGQPITIEQDFSLAVKRL